MEELLLTAAVLFLPIVYMTAAFALLADIGIDMERGRWVFPTGLLLWGIAVAALHREEKWQRRLATLLLVLAIFALAVWAASFLADIEWDSRHYHARAILGLLEGRNPYWEPRSWITYTYPTAHWLLSASLVVWTQLLTTSVVFTVIAVVAAFLCARRFLATLPHLSRASSRSKRNLLAALLAGNPIAFSCFFMNYNDGFLVSVLLSVFMLMLCFVCEEGSQRENKRRLRRTAFCIVCLLVFLINIKFTGLVFGGALGLTALAYGVRRGASRKTLVRLAGLGSGAALLGVALFGFFPYSTNAYLHGNPVHPFYPAIVFGEGKQEIAFLEEANPVFLERLQYEEWWIGLFSQTQGDWRVPAPLPPFSSLSPISFLDGFGSLFSGSLLLCLTLVFFVRHRGGLLVLAGVGVSILSFGVGLSSRHAPQNWWLPMLFLVFLLAPDEKSSPLSRSLSRAQRAIVFVVVACMLYISVARLMYHGNLAVALSQVVRQAERQGGWFVVPDLQMKHHTEAFFRYYNSGLSGVRLPTMLQCPDKAEKMRPLDGLALCKPQ